MKPKKCPYWKKCKLYNPDNKTCNEDEGFYGSRYPGCVRNIDSRDHPIMKTVSNKMNIHKK